MQVSDISDEVIHEVVTHLFSSPPKKPTRAVHDLISANLTIEFPLMPKQPRDDGILADMPHGPRRDLTFLPTPHKRHPQSAQTLAIYRAVRSLLGYVSPSFFNEFQINKIYRPAVPAEDGSFVWELRLQSSLGLALAKIPLINLDRFFDKDQNRVMTLTFRNPSHMYQDKHHARKMLLDEASTSRPRRRVKGDELYFLTHVEFWTIKEKKRKDPLFQKSLDELRRSISIKASPYIKGLASFIYGILIFLGLDHSTKTFSQSSVVHVPPRPPGNLPPPPPPPDPSGKGKSVLVERFSWSEVSLDSDDPDSMWGIERKMLDESDWHKLTRKKHEKIRKLYQKYLDLQVELERDRRDRVRPPDFFASLRVVVRPWIVLRIIVDMWQSAYLFFKKIQGFFSHVWGEVEGVLAVLSTVVQLACAVVLVCGGILAGAFNIGGKHMQDEGAKIRDEVNRENSSSSVDDSSEGTGFYERAIGTRFGRSSGPPGGLLRSGLKRSSSSLASPGKRVSFDDNRNSNPGGSFTEQESEIPRFPPRGGPRTPEDQQDEDEFAKTLQSIEEMDRDRSPSPTPTLTPNEPDSLPDIPSVSPFNTLKNNPDSTNTSRRPHVADLFRYLGSESEDGAARPGTGTPVHSREPSAQNSSSQLGETPAEEEVEPAQPTSPARVPSPYPGAAGPSSHPAPHRRTSSVDVLPISENEENENSSAPVPSGVVASAASSNDSTAPFQPASSPSDLQQPVQNTKADSLESSTLVSPPLTSIELRPSSTAMQQTPSGLLDPSGGSPELEQIRDRQGSTSSEATFSTSSGGESPRTPGDLSGNLPLSPTDAGQQVRKQGSRSQNQQRPFQSQSSVQPRQQQTSPDRTPSSSPMVRSPGFGSSGGSGQGSLSPLNLTPPQQQGQWNAGPGQWGQTPQQGTPRPGPGGIGVGVPYQYGQQGFNNQGGWAQQGQGRGQQGQGPGPRRGSGGWNTRQGMQGRSDNNNPPSPPQSRNNNSPPQARPNNSPSQSRDSQAQGNMGPPPLPNFQSSENLDWASDAANACRGKKKKRGRGGGGGGGRGGPRGAYQNQPQQ
ncbi:hypothetical protein T439DRAFT_358160 [Meredithblackwellia eburnea MCA 4105]